MTLDKYLTQLVQITDLDALNLALTTELEAEGAACVVGFKLPYCQTAHPADQTVMINTFPEAVQVYYDANDAAKDDPLLSAALAVGQPVQFTELQASMRLRPKQADLWDVMNQNGLFEGLAMPIVHRPGCVSYFGIGFEAQRDMPSAWKRRIFVMIEEYCVRRDQISKKTGYDRFTLRERQVLAGIVNGESNTHIAVNLGLSDHTVATYTKRAFAKLGTKTRHEATLRLVGMSDTSLIESQLVNPQVEKVPA